MNQTERIYKMSLASVYPLYVQKAERKGRTKGEVDEIICWLTGYDADGLKNMLEQKADFETFFGDAPGIHPNAKKITGLICGHRIEDIEDPLIRKVRYLDKLIDELARGKDMKKILRSE